jgi:hypothetical protein
MLKPGLIILQANCAEAAIIDGKKTQTINF